MYSDEEFAKLDPELEEIFKTRGIPKLPVPTKEIVPLFRQGYSKTFARFNKGPFVQEALGTSNAPPSWTEDDITIPVRDGSSIKALLHRPKTIPKDGAPVTVFCHGGGWFMGVVEDEAFICRLLAHKLGHIVVNFEYRLYPDVNFPVPITDCFDAFKWTAANIARYGGNPAKGFLIGGTSGGGTYASIVTHLARDEKPSPPITGCFLLCPILQESKRRPDGSLETRYPGRNRSPELNANAPLMTTAMQKAIESLADYDYDSPLLTPFNFQQHDRLPPLYLAVCGLDPWRDSGILYGEEVQKGGAEVRTVAYPGVPHCWWSTFPQLKVTQQWLKDTLEGIQWLSDQQAPPGKNSHL